MRRSTKGELIMRASTGILVLLLPHVQSRAHGETFTLNREQASSLARLALMGIPTE